MPEQKLIRISISEAGRLFGVNAQTVRRAIKAGALEYIIVQGRYKVDFESVLRWSQKNVAVRNKVAVRGIGKYVQAWRLHDHQAYVQPVLPVKKVFMPPPPKRKKRASGRRATLAQHPTLPI